MLPTLLLTGATGFVGSRLVHSLQSWSKPHCLTRSANNAVPNPIVWDGQSLPVLQQHLDRLRPGIVVHLAAISPPDHCELHREEALHANTAFTAALADWCEKAGAYLLFLSTDFVFSGKADDLLLEDEQPAPVNYYGETKKLAEDAVRSSEGEWCIVRTALVYGKASGTRQNLLTVTAANLHNGKDCHIFSDQLRTPTYVEDLAWAINELTRQKKTGIYHIAGAEMLTPFQMAQATALHLGYDAGCIQPVKRGEMEQTAIRPLRTQLSIEKAKREIGYNPTLFAEGLVRTFETS